MEHGLSKTRLYSIYSGMKRTSNQKVVTAAIQNRPSKALSAPYQACTALPDRNTAYAVTIQNRGLWRIAIYRFQIGKLPPGAMSVRVQICSRKIPGTGRVALLCKVTFQIEP